MTQRFHPDDLVPLLRGLERGTVRTGEEIIAELGGLRIDAASEERAARLVCELITKEPLGYLQARIGRSHWRDYMETAPGSVRTMRLAAGRLNAINRRVFQLYEADFGRTRETMHRLAELSAENRHVVPYLDVLIQNAAEVELGEREWTTRSLAEKTVRELFDERGILLRFVEAIVARGEPLKQHGGLTNTLLGAYDWMKTDRVLALATLPLADATRLDLGGGFATPDTSDLLGHPFTSLDISSPASGGALSLGRISRKPGKPSERIGLPPSEREAYLQRLASWPWRRFDVFSDAIDDGDDEYFITSFGFMSSTVTSIANTQADRVPRRLRSLNTTYCAVRVVLELVACGKTVGLLVAQRATSRAYLYRAAYLRFIDHVLVEHRLAAESFQGRFGRGVVPARHNAHKRKG